MSIGRTMTKLHTARRVWRRISRGERLERFEGLKAAGRLKYGVASYGVPTIIDHPHENCSLCVGNYTSISPDSTIVLGGEHPTDRLTTFPLRIILNIPGAWHDGFPAESRDTIIGSDVWVGARATILSGARIGNGAVVAAGSLVAQDVPSYAVVGGVPARVIRFRFNADVISQLEELAWWDWPEHTIREAAEVLSGHLEADSLARLRDLKLSGQIDRG
ncbi:MAG TPA: CatB-related O-acetyltransferase [Marmoricola sp.]|nr:CatB-related O-acetyltransferase [Marmoricola sp.]